MWLIPATPSWPNRRAVLSINDLGEELLHIPNIRRHPIRRQTRQKRLPIPLRPNPQVELHQHAVRAEVIPNIETKESKGPRRSYRPETQQEVN